MTKPQHPKKSWWSPRRLRRSDRNRKEVVRLHDDVNKKVKKIVTLEGDEFVDNRSPEELKASKTKKAEAEAPVEVAAKAVVAEAVEATAADEEAEAVTEAEAVAEAVDTAEAEAVDDDDDDDVIIVSEEEVAAIAAAKAAAVVPIVIIDRSSPGRTTTLQQFVERKWIGDNGRTVIQCRRGQETTTCEDETNLDGKSVFEQPYGTGKHAVVYLDHFWGIVEYPYRVAGQWLLYCQMFTLAPTERWATLPRDRFPDKTEGTHLFEFRFTKFGSDVQESDYD